MFSQCNPPSLLSKREEVHIHRLIISLNDLRQVHADAKESEDAGSDHGNVAREYMVSGDPEAKGSGESAIGREEVCEDWEGVEDVSGDVEESESHY